MDEVQEYEIKCRSCERFMATIYGAGIVKFAPCRCKDKVPMKVKIVPTDTLALLQFKFPDVKIVNVSE